MILVLLIYRGFSSFDYEQSVVSSKFRFFFLRIVTSGSGRFRANLVVDNEWTSSRSVWLKVHVQCGAFLTWLDSKSNDPKVRRRVSGNGVSSFSIKITWLRREKLGDLYFRKKWRCWK